MAAMASMPSAIVAASARQDAKPDAKKWDLGRPIPRVRPHHSRLRTPTEGTLDERRCQSGRLTQVVLNLLGDIYLMPMAGSSTPAKPVDEWRARSRCSRRFSPDGTRIAFASDRDGLWNIWTVDVASKDGTDRQTALAGAAVVREQPGVGAGRRRTVLRSAGTS